jgi:hypothetical protein
MRRDPALYHCLRNKYRWQSMVSENARQINMIAEAGSIDGYHRPSLHRRPVAREQMKKLRRLNVIDFDS